MSAAVKSYMIIPSRDTALEMPKHSKILSVSTDEWGICIWALVEEKFPMENRRILVVMQSEVNAERVVGYPFIGTVKFNERDYHLFDGGTR